MIKKVNFLKVYLLLSICSATHLNAAVIKYSNNNQTYSLPRIEQEIVIDGNIDDKAWQQALRFELNIETKPGENTEAPVKTTAYMFEDGDSLYIAFKADDHDPSQIRAHYHDHDLIFDDDVVGIKLDTANDDLYAYQFFVNALGVKHDSIEDAALSQDDMSWNEIWDAAAKITAHGYQVEIAIPLRILRFDDTKEEQVWGFDLLRFYPREVLHRISYHEVDRNNSCSLCQNAKFTGLKNIVKGKNLSIVPFMTATQNQNKDIVNNKWNDDDIDTEFGADLRWGINPNTTLNATINPDFSQVESDVAQFDNNVTFSLFYPEKRQFFVEGADYYKSLINIVHTRNITDPDYGMKITHSRDGDDYAAFFSNDTQTNYVIPGSLESNFASLQTNSLNGVMRYRHNLENTSFIGAIVTMREADDYHNYVYGVDGSYRLSDSDVIRAQILNSDTEDPQSIVSELSGSAADLHYKHQDRDWTIWGRYTRLAKGFRADLGFEPRVNYNRYLGGFRRFWFNESNRWWNNFSAGIDSRYSYDLEGDVIHNWINGTLNYQGARQSEVELNYSTGEETWAAELYDTRELLLSGRVTVVGGFKLSLELSKKDTIDYVNSQAAELTSISPRLTLNLGQHFQTEIRYTKQNMDVSGGELFNANLFDARLIYQFSVQSFLRLVIQYSDIDKTPSLYNFAVDEKNSNLGTQLLYSYKINPQTVFFLGYSDAAFEDDSLNQLQKVDKSLFLKMSYSWLR